MSAAGAPTLVISEVFGPTFQGEGPSLGQRAAFVRLGRCNLACSWCDTPYTWRWADHDPAAELAERTVDDIAATVERMAAPLVVITGGEPLLQQRNLVPLAARLRDLGHVIEVETAGTLAPSPDLTEAVTRFNVSPKLANSGNPLARRYHPDVLRTFVATGQAVFKFVATGVDDLDEIQGIADECELGSVWVMPEGTDPEQLIARGRALADDVLGRGWHLTTRLHVLLWGNERGR